MGKSGEAVEAREVEQEHAKWQNRKNMSNALPTPAIFATGGAAGTATSMAMIQKDTK